MLPFSHRMLRLRLARGGHRNRPVWKVIATDSRKRRDTGAPLERLGSYDPLPDESGSRQLRLNVERVKYWLQVSVCLASLPAMIFFFAIGALVECSRCLICIVCLIVVRWFLVSLTSFVLSVRVRSSALSRQSVWQRSSVILTSFRSRTESH